MKRAVYLAVAFVAALALAPTAVTVSADTDDGLPILHKIQTVTLSPSYSCRSHAAFDKGYENTALYLSRYSRELGAPDLVFNGACKSNDFFEGSTLVGDMSLIADLGEMRLEDVSAQVAFNPKGVAGYDARFSMRATVFPGHSYAMLINKRDFRGLAVFRVEDYTPNKSVRLRYAVKEYQLIAKRTESTGFDWRAKNSE